MSQYRFVVNTIKWFDKINGNTYFSNRITNIESGEVICSPFQYGYGDHYRFIALKDMDKNNWIPKKYSPKPGFNSIYHLYERENNYPILWNCHNGLKRDCIANGIN